MNLSDNRFTVSESTGDIVEPFNNTVISTLSTTPLSDDAVKSAIIDWAAEEWGAGRQERALKTLALVAAENINRTDL
jgi:hypothetical protein